MEIALSRQPQREKSAVCTAVVSSSATFTFVRYYGSVGWLSVGHSDPGSLYGIPISAVSATN